MKLHTKRTMYEAPLTVRYHVEMEATFCAASGDVIKKDNSGLNAEGHDQGGAFEPEVTTNGSFWE